MSSQRIFRYMPPPGGWDLPRGRRRKPPIAPIAAGLVLVLVLSALLFWARRSAKEPIMEPSSFEIEAEAAKAEQPRGLVYGYPTEQTRLLDIEDESVFMPTASGRVESAHFGSTRTVQRGNRLRASFHEGIDIAPLRRDRRGRPLDDIFAVADGEVAYINRHAGNSSYGIYVVLLHSDPVGTTYTLYAHLTSASENLKPGDLVERGHVIGRMGNTSTQRIPMQRAHLHFEIGTLMNHRFDRWFREQGLTPTAHGRYNGWNLRGLDPLDIYRNRTEAGLFSLLAWFRRAEPAFAVMVDLDRPLDYFERYPKLWAGPRLKRGVAVLYAQEGGLIVRGRAATEEEQALLDQETAAVLEVNENLLGRNGRRIVVRQGQRWTLGSYGRQWIEKLTYH